MYPSGMNRIEHVKEHKGGFLGLPEAPVFYPTEEEFLDPYIYIEQIRHVAEPYGLCRIVPPSTWNPPFAIDTKSFTFPTKLQEIHHLQVRPAARDAETFKLEYDRFLAKKGLKLEGWPTFLGKELDLCKLFSAVKRHGGYQKVLQDNKWGEVLQIVDPECVLTPQTSLLQSTLRKLYESHLQDYERHQSCYSRGKRQRFFNVQEASCCSRGRRNSRRRIEDIEIKDEKAHMEDVISGVDQVCEQCHSGAHEQVMLLCDRCDRGWHLYCLTPPLSAVPSGNWYCFDCLTSEAGTFGFIPEESRTFDSFRRLADRFKKKWFAGKEATFSEIEEEFWSIVERCKGPVEVLYGSDLASEVYGSGFPRSSDPVPGYVDKVIWEQYASSPWNLNNFTKLKGSVLKYVQENIPGVTVPWVYMGMLFSSFCWHYEDQCFYSINYLHWGDPKCWYAVPGSAVNDFEQVMQKTFPDLFEAQPDLLFQLVTMLNPKVLCENNVPVCTTLQECGNFVITFPRSYHGGFNHGLNCAEAVNFATVDWLPHGRFAIERTRLYHKAAVLSHEELLCVISKNAGASESSSWLKEELSHMIALEKKQRMRLWRAGIIWSSRMVPRKCANVIGTEEDPVCVICRYHLFMSALTCSCCLGKAVCLQHSDQLCECNRGDQRLLYRFSLAELDDLQMKIHSAGGGQVSVVRGWSKRKYKRRCKQSETMQTLKKVNGNMFSHTKLAEAWVKKAEDVLHSVRHPCAVENVLIEAEEFLWAGHEMDNVRHLEKDLCFAKDWAQGVHMCIDAAAQNAEPKEENLERAQLCTALELLALDPFPCDIEEDVIKLKSYVAKCIDLQQQANVLLSSCHPWKPLELEALQEKLGESPLKFPEAERIKEFVNTARAWGQKVRDLIARAENCSVSREQRFMDMDKLLQLQREGYQLPVVLPEMQELDRFISRLKNWQERAQGLIGSFVPLQVAEGLLLEIGTVPIYFHEAEILEKQILEANEWKNVVLKVLAEVNETFHTGMVDLLSSLKDAGDFLDLEVDEVTLVKNELKRLSWMQKAVKGMQYRLTTKDLLEIMEEGCKLSLENNPIYLELHKVVQDAQEWECKASEYLENGASLDDYIALRRDSGKIYASLQGWIDVNTSVMQAESFLQSAYPFLERNQQVDCCLKLENLQELLYCSCNLRVNVPEIQNLYKLLNDSNSWATAARVLIQSARDILCCSNILLEDELLLFDLNNCISEGRLLKFEFEELAELEGLVTATEYHLQASQLVLGCPAVKDLKSFIQEASSFPNSVSQLQQLKCNLNKAEQWLEKVQNIVWEQGLSVRYTTRDLEDLLDEAKDLRVDVAPNVGYLQELLMSHKLWKEEVSKYLYPPNQPATWEELCCLQEKRRTTHIIKCEEADVLEKELAKCESWVLKCFGKLLNESDVMSLSLIELLMKVRISVDNALQQLQNMSCDGQEKVCRVCKTHAHMLCCNFVVCDNCGDRYHDFCLGIKQSQERGRKQFICSFCTAFAAGVLWLDERISSKIFITRRPTLNALQELLEAAKGLNIRLEEVELLRCITRRVQAWHTCLNEIVEPVLRPHSNEDYSSSCLLSALKIAGTIEVQIDGNSKLALALSINAWRMQCKSLMENCTKPSYRAICRILEEGLLIPSLSDDCLLKELETWEAMASEWLAEANKVMEDNGLTSVEDVLQLITEGERLPVAFNKEIADLKSRTILYCICRKPYDKDRPMIACDCCSEWFHVDCVNQLTSSCTNDDCNDSDGMMQRRGSLCGDFLCPDCKALGKQEAPKPITEGMLNLIAKSIDDSNNFPKEEMDASAQSVHQETDIIPATKESMHQRKEMVYSNQGSLHLQEEAAHHSKESYYMFPLWYTRGKRSSRSSIRLRADLQERRESYNRILYCSSTRSQRRRSSTCLGSSRRPCRRTAGTNSHKTKGRFKIRYQMYSSKWNNFPL